MRGDNRGGNYPSLYEVFELGDRVKRFYRDGNGEREIRGVVLKVAEESIEVYWDTVNGKYRPPSMEVAFTTCSVEEIFKGNGKYSPIMKER